MPRVLAVDDDAAAIADWAMLLDGLANVESAPSRAALDALGAAWERRWPFQFVLIGVSCSQGVDLVRRISAFAPRPHVAVFLDSLDSLLVAEFSGGCILAAPKPADRTSLIRTLRILRATERRTPTLERFARAHRLSPQETKLVASAVREMPNKQSADELGCTEGTLRTYWKRIFTKIGCTSQRDVVARLFRFGDEDAAPDSVESVSKAIGLD
jgi:DNA-binding CsgD family transcriptional regulator